MLTCGSLELAQPHVLVATMEGLLAVKFQIHHGSVVGLSLPALSAATVVY